jgi:tRNA G18 (ribose-2'-O)-methylase SpoU
MDEAAETAGHISVISTGWDPGIFSMERVVANAFLPGSRAYGFYGLGEAGGLSMGHSDALRTIDGVKDARQYTHAVTESIEKPGNLGTILRSADAAAVAAVIVCDRTTDIHNPNVVRASTGTMFSVPVVEATSEEALAWLKSRGFKILAATPHAQKLHFEVDLTGNVAIALGAEQYGLTAKWMDGAELRVRIPMLGLADSLNVSAAATILVYEAVRQRLAAGIARAPAFIPWHGEGAHDH